MKFAILYPAHDKDRRSTEESRAARLRHAGRDVITAPFYLDRKLSPDGLDALWQVGDKRLLYLYHLVEEKLQGRDVLIVADKGVAHPEFLRRIKTYNVLVGNAGDMPAEAAQYDYRYASGMPGSDPLAPDVKAETKWLDDLTEAIAPHVAKHAAGNFAITPAYDRRPTIVMLADDHNWAYDFSAQSIKRELQDEFDLKIGYIEDRPREEFMPFTYDLLHVCFWGERWHHRLRLPRKNVIKEISSFRWRVEEHYGLLSTEAFIEKHLQDAGTYVVTSRKMEDTLKGHISVLYTPNGIDPLLFYPTQRRREGALRIGWAGSIKDKTKGILDIIQPACGEEFELVVATGGVQARDDMRAFYNSIDVLCIASIAEGEPLTLLEAMACGCFVVSVDVGLVPEIIVHGENGLIVPRSIEAFRAAFMVCRDNLDAIRRNSEKRAAETHATRSWKAVIPYWRTAFQQALARARQVE